MRSTDELKKRVGNSGESGSEVTDDELDMVTGGQISPRPIENPVIKPKEEGPLTYEPRPV